VKYLSIQYGSEYMRANHKGQIMRSDDGFRTFSVSPSDNWRITHAVRRNNFGNIVERFSLADIIAGGIQWKYKNGSQRVFLKDFDHGGYREWRSPSHSVNPVGA
jgi:hypothetical protein